MAVSRKVGRRPGAARGSALRRFSPAAVLTFGALLARSAQAAFLSGDTLDLVADILSWVVLIIAPFIAIGVFWIVHILPEKIAERRQHPQLSAIKTLCLLSLVFGGLLWPLAWLWAYTKPVLHKIAYGTEVVEPEHEPPASSAIPAATDVDAALEVPPETPRTRVHDHRS